jgi:hypothetical protein
MDPGSFSPVSINYFGTNLHKGLAKLVPAFYLEEDYNLSGSKITPVDALLSSHLSLAANISSVLPIAVGSLTGTIYSGLNTISGISNYFVIQNNLTYITQEKFEKNVLAKLNKTFADFATSSSYVNYLSSTFIPGIRLNTPTLSFNGVTNTHQFLIEQLSWLYFLNTSGHGNLSYQPSAGIFPLLSNLYGNVPIRLQDAIKVLEAHLWNNKSVSSVFSSYIPVDQLQSEYGLENIQTLCEILYSDLYTDSKNFKVRDSFIQKFNRTYEAEVGVNGPFARLLQAFSFSFANINEDVDRLNLLYDIQDCPDELLPELANLIGWRLFGFNPQRWRLQLANAVDIYKRAGTKQSLQVAVDSLFTPDIFNLSSNIYELWESYLPNLAYYALGTDSSAFDSFKTWTPTLANRIGVSGYSTSSMDENIRIAVDSIILTLVTEFPTHFSVAGNRFPVGDPDFKFAYRGRVFPIPPWEEYPYYVNADLSEDLIDRFTDLLVCFGVRESFALDVRDYIIENTIGATDDLRLGNGWLIFLPSATLPSNLDYVINRIGEKNIDSLNAWCHKSSHFKLILESSDFDFTKGTFDEDSYHALREVSRVVAEFSPAHSIPDIRVNTNTTDEYDATGVSAIIVAHNVIDGYYSMDLSGQTNKALANYETYGTNTRTIYPSATFDRRFSDHIADAAFSSTSFVNVPRTSFRRRDMAYGMGLNGYYSRTGFNMPVGWQPSTLEYSLPSSLGFLPLGYIPSACKYQEISSVHNLPQVYRYCNLTGSSVFYGVPVSATFPCRGLSSLDSGRDLYVDRGQLPDLFAVAHTLREKEKYILAEKAIDPSLSAYQKDFYWKDVYQSYANQYLSGFPNDFTDYQRTPFGRQIHKLYRKWVTDFYMHGLASKFFDLNGPTIFAHCYGSILENSDFVKEGLMLSGNPEFQASSPAELVKLNKTNVFTVPSTYETYAVTGTSDHLVSSRSSTIQPPKEYRNRSLFSGIELVYPSHISNDNYFSFLKLAPRFGTVENDYFVNNTMLIMKSYQSMMRIKYNLRSPTYDLSEGYGTTKNFLSPDHRFSFKVKGAALSDDGQYLGGMTLGVWVHTDFEGDQFYTYTGGEQWTLCDRNNITDANVLDWSFKYNIPLNLRDLRDKDKNKKLQCITLVLNKNKTSPILTITDDDFVEFNVEFHTKNIFQQLLPDYVRAYGQLHKKTQNYIVEFFIVPNESTRDKVFILDNVNLIDSTLEEHTKYTTSWGEYVGRPFNPYCPARKIQLSEDELLCLFQSFHKYQLDFGSRWYQRLYVGVIDDIPSDLNRGNSNSIVAMMGAEGGSRLNYRIHPNWFAATGTGNYYSSIQINN